MTKDAFGVVVDALARRDLTSTELEQRLARVGGRLVHAQAHAAPDHQLGELL